MTSNDIDETEKVKLHSFAGERVFTESLPILELIEESFPDTPKELIQKPSYES